MHIRDSQLLFRKEKTEMSIALTLAKEKIIYNIVTFPKTINALRSSVNQSG